jgi:Pilus assembly protein, PilO
MRDQLTPKLLAAFAAIAIVLVALIGWYGFISPQRDDADALDAKIVEQQKKLEVAKLLSQPQANRGGKGKTTTFNVLSKAMPATVRMSGVLRQVQSLADASGITLDSFAPSSAVVLSGYEAIPIDIAVTGRYADIQRFLKRLRVQARSADGRPLASGRLFDVQTLGLSGTSPELSATIQMATFVYSGVAPVPATTTETTTTETTTTEETS